MDKREIGNADYDRIQDEAASWVVKKSLGLSVDEQRDFEEWLNVDPEHRERVVANERVWEDAAELKGLDDEFRDLKTSWDKREGKSTRLEAVSWGKWLAVAVAAACIAITFLLFAPSVSVDQSDRSFQGDVTASVFQRTFLPDGTLVELNQGTEISVDYTNERRRVRLIAGEAHFSITKDLSRPFEVEAGTARFEAVGTAFSVRLEEAEVKLLVTEGVVRLSADEPVAALGAEPSIAKVVKELKVNERAVLPLKGPAKLPLVEAVSESEVETQLSWKHETLEFEATPLAEVILAFNQRNRDKLVIDDTSLGEIEIDGSFRSDNLKAFVRLLRITAEIESEHTEHGKIRLYR